MIHARSIALSDLSEVGKPQGRQLNPTEQMIAAVGEDAHQIALAVEALLEALRGRYIKRAQIYACAPT